MAKGKIVQWTMTSANGTCDYLSKDEAAILVEKKIIKLNGIVPVDDGKEACYGFEKGIDWDQYYLARILLLNDLENKITFLVDTFNGPHFMPAMVVKTLVPMSHELMERIPGILHASIFYDRPNDFHHLKFSSPKGNVFDIRTYRVFTYTKDGNNVECWQGCPMYLQDDFVDHIVKNATK